MKNSLNVKTVRYVEVADLPIHLQLLGEEIFNNLADEEYVYLTADEVDFLEGTTRRDDLISELSACLRDNDCCLHVKE